jgi:hypothetical protein
MGRERLMDILVERSAVWIVMLNSTDGGEFFAICDEATHGRTVLRGRACFVIRRAAREFLKEWRAHGGTGRVCRAVVEVLAEERR